MVLQATDNEAKDFALRYLRPVWNNCRPSKPPVRRRPRPVHHHRLRPHDALLPGIWNEANFNACPCVTPSPTNAGWRRLDTRRTERASHGLRLDGQAHLHVPGRRAGDEFHQLHESTDQRDWNMRCPKCDHLQPWLWEQIRFPRTRRLRALGICPRSAWHDLRVRGCRTLLPDTNATRLEANARGMFVSTANIANAGHIGLH